MKPEETLDVLKRMRIALVTARVDGIRVLEPLNIAIAATEKQVPKKPRYYMDMYNHERPGCPECPRNEILYAGQKYCSVCGTKIDWSDPKHD
ncbi:MAG TPA: hypothetical protein DEF30_08310 [Proteiniclasticum sp.]|uniref:hypothetical protein n=1 Tax=Proteiniclasticum sp. TaxID=2053595 RepID=UPI000E9851D6|nr:hypothetical protein [Proteiniclasticum sp.]HBW13803.1 hypothetical protein [Proteiniclasticum sp.]